MERKVLSFDQFILESYQTINEELTIKSLQNRLEGGEQVNKALALVGDIFSKAKKGESAFSSEMDSFEEFLDRLDKRSKYMSYDVSLTTNEIVLDSVVQGRVYLSKDDLGNYTVGSNFEKDLLPGDGDNNSLLQLLAAINAENIDTSRFRTGFMDSSDGKLVKNTSNKDLVEDTGLKSQISLIKTRGSVQALKFRGPDYKVPNFNSEGLEGITPNNFDKKLKDIDVSFLLYGIKNIQPGEGNPMEGTKLVKEVIQKGGKETKKLEILNGDPKNPVLFDQDKAVLKDGGKDAIRNSLGIFTKIDKIKVTGGASQEGPDSRNKELCKLRAEAVSKFLGEITKADISVNPEGVIQPKEDSSNRESWRRVILDIVGETESNKMEEVIVYNTSAETLKADKYTIAQMVLTFKISLNS